MLVKNITDARSFIKIDLNGNEILILNSLKVEILNHYKSLLEKVRKKTSDTIKKITKEKEYIFRDTKGSNLIWVKHK